MFPGHVREGLVASIPFIENASPQSTDGVDIVDSEDESERVVN
jgi:hypothetical protein